MVSPFFCMHSVSTQPLKSILFHLFLSSSFFAQFGNWFLHYCVKETGEHSTGDCIRMESVEGEKLGFACRPVVLLYFFQYFSAFTVVYNVFLKIT